MNQNIVKLVELQDIDTRIHELDMSSTDFPREKAQRESAIAAASAALEEARGQLTALHGEQENLQTTVGDAGQSLERSQSRLGSITTNREYDAIHAEIEAGRQAVANAKGRITAIEGEQTGAEQAVADAQAALEKAKSENEPRIAELREKIAGIDGQRAQMLQQRASLLPGIDGRFLRAYENIQKRRKDACALSYVTVESHTCERCHKVLEPQLQNEVRHGTRLSVCQSCGSILVWKAVSDGAQPVQQ